MYLKSEVKKIVLAQPMTVFDDEEHGGLSEKTFLKKTER